STKRIMSGVAGRSTGVSSDATEATAQRGNDQPSGSSSGSAPSTSVHPLRVNFGGCQSMTLSQVVAFLEARGAPVIALIVQFGRRKAFGMPVSGPMSDGGDRFRGRGDDRVEDVAFDVAFDVANIRRNSTHGILRFDARTCTMSFSENAYGSLLKYFFSFFEQVQISSSPLTTRTK
ncbi:hypothetical protein AAVH_32915, partial [Aphelenchoides avenae]